LPAIGYLRAVATHSQIAELGQRFGALFYTGHIDPGGLSALEGLTIDEAYQAQQVAVTYRLQRRETLVGYKVGCTSQSIRQQLGLTEPYFARMTAPHVQPESDSTLDWTHYVSLALEPELVICIGRDIRPDRVTDADLIAAIAHLSAGIELHHFKFWHGKPTAQELIISNGLFAGLVVGAGRMPAPVLDFQTEVFRLLQDGALVAEGVARDIMGGPLESLRWLAAKLAQGGEIIKAGQLVIPGSPVALVPIKADADVTVEISRVGQVRVRFRAAQV
jgi:2-keto-4-pentenoate hydratase